MTETKNDPSIEAVLIALHRYQMENEAKMVTQLCNSVDSLQINLNEVSKQLEEVQSQLNGIKNKGLKQLVNQGYQDINNKCSSAKKKLKSLKNDMSSKAAEIANDVQNQGRHGFTKLKDFLAFKKPFKSIQKKVNSITEECQAVIDKVDSFSKRLSDTKEQFKIAGNTLIGKEVFIPAERQHYVTHEKLSLMLIKKSFEAIKSVCQKVNTLAENKVSDKHYYAMVNKMELEQLNMYFESKGLLIKSVPSTDIKDKFIVQINKADKKQINIALCEPKSVKL